MTNAHSPAQSRSKPSVCIVSHMAYGAVCGGRSGHIGGVEWQTSLLAKWLARNGHPVSLLTWDEGGPPVEVIDQVRVIKVARQRAGLKGVRFFHPKWTGLIRAMRQAGADVYYHNSCECVTGQIALWCRRNNKPFVFSSQSDTDFDPKLPCLETPVERLLYRYGLRHADMIIVQTQAQQAALKAAFGLGAKVIPMPCPEPAHAYDRAPHLDSKATRVLWIARICKQKRPDRFLDLAQACPDIQFDLAGPVYPDAYAQSVYARAIQIPNVTVHGPVGRDQVPALYQHAACLCSTSDFEGFPNTFLEAWSHGLPIVSTFDPDSLISKRNLGIVAKDIPGFQSALRSLLGSPDRYRQISHNARKYFLENHRSEVVMPKFEEVFLDLCKGSNGQVVTEQAQSLEASVLS